MRIRTRILDGILIQTDTPKHARTDRAQVPDGKTVLFSCNVRVVLPFRHGAVSELGKNRTDRAVPWDEGRGLSPSTRRIAPLAGGQSSREPSPGPFLSRGEPFPLVLFSPLLPFRSSSAVGLAFPTQACPTPAIPRILAEAVHDVRFRESLGRRGNVQVASVEGIPCDSKQGGSPVVALGCFGVH